VAALKKGTRACGTQRYATQINADFGDGSGLCCTQRTLTTDFDDVGARSSHPIPSQNTLKTRASSQENRRLSAYKIGVAQARVPFFSNFMSNILHIAWREWRSYFASWLAYALLAGWSVIGGLTWLFALKFPDNFQLTSLYSNLLTMLLFLSPLLTMRLIADERREGTFDLLFSAPVSEWQVTLGKWLGTMGMIALLLLLTAPFPFLAFRYGSIDAGPIWGSYAAMICAGAAFGAWGLLCSSLSNSSAVAAFLAFGGLTISMMIGFLPRLMPGNVMANSVGAISIFAHLEPMGRGALDTRDLVFFASLTLGFWFATTRVLESRRWR